MQIFSAADVGGLVASQEAQRTIAFGDLASAVLALGSLWALRGRTRLAVPLVWVFVIVGTVDLISSTVVGIHGQLTNTASDLSWFILAFYVPFLWVSIVVIVWQLVSRQRASEPSLWHLAA